MLERFAIKDFGCVRDVSGTLTPLHAFIGPNDSGKSTLLRAFEVVGTCMSGRRLGDLRTGHDGARVEVGARVGGERRGFEVRLQPHKEPVGRQMPSGERVSHDAIAFAGSPFEGVASPALVRFDADALRQPSPLIPRAESARFVSQRGLGLPAMLLDIRGRHDDLEAQIRQRMTDLFPHVQGISLPSVDTQRVGLEVVLHDGTVVPAARMSEGFLYYLAFEVLRHVHGVRVLLVEEPENGLHPSRVRDIVRLLRRLSEDGMQVIMATHSPLVVNELEPDEVTLVTRPGLDVGTRLTPIRQTKNFARRSEVYALGELWLSYADGEDEEELVSREGDGGGPGGAGDDEAAE